MTEKIVDPTEFLDGVFWEASKQNVISRLLFNNFFSCIKKMTEGFPETSKMLEVGCGVGFSSLRIKEMMPNADFEISDFDENFVRNMQSKGFPIKVTQESVLALHREDKSFDCIFLLEVLEHVEDYEKALSELFRVSRGFVVISVPNEPLWRIGNMLRGKYLKLLGNTPGHINHWSPSSFKKLVSKYGFIEKMMLPFPWTIILARVIDEAG